MQNLSELLKSVTCVTLHGANIAVEYKLPEDLWSLEVDPEQLEQVIQNLVTNALQALPSCGGHLYISAVNTKLLLSEVRDLPPGDYILLTIQDDGTGIEEGQLSHIFEPYFTTRPGSSGIGLTVCYSIIKRYKGHIEVESAPGQGTTFRIYLPANQLACVNTSVTLGPALKKVSPAEFKLTTVQAVGSRSPRLSVNPRILVVDDEAIIRQLLQRLLTRFGYEIVAVETGAEAIEHYRIAFEEGRPFKAVITDLTLTDGLGGEGIAREVLKLDPGAILLISSGFCQDKRITDYASYGFRATIPKPYEVRELVQTLESCLEQN